MDGESIRTRQCLASDRDEIAKFWMRVFPDAQGHNAPEKVIDEKFEVDKMIYLAEKIDDKGAPKIVGTCMAGYDGHRGWLYSVAVATECRRAGIGRQLVLLSIEELKRLGCKKINLQVRSDNAEVAKFYESLGFAIEDRVSMGLLVE